MKNLIIAAGLAAALASPAFAQSYDPDLGSGNVGARISTPAPRLGLDTGAYGAYARVRHGDVVHVRRGGAGDPDRNIRFQLNRESEQGRW